MRLGEWVWRGGLRTDPITHGLIGASLAVLSGHTIDPNDPIFLGCTLGAMLPDLDIVTYVKGRLNYLLKHRGISHSFLALGGMALTLTPILYSFFPQTAWNTILFWTLVGTLSHGIVDVLNSYGAELLWPFFKKKLTVDMIILTDPVIFGLFLTSLLVSAKMPTLGARSTLTAILAGVFYLSYRQIKRVKTRNAVMAAYHVENKKEIKILPAMYRPFSWNFLLLEKRFVRFGTIRHKTPEVERVLPHWDEQDPYVNAALEGILAEVFDQFTPYYHILTQESEDDQCRVEFLDLRYWTKKDFLYTGKVLMNSDFEIFEETFYTPNSEGILLSY
ncbi:MAG: metal-dependent hydrolase [Desulfitobacteriaceae bacterium]